MKVKYFFVLCLYAISFLCRAEMVTVFSQNFDLLTLGTNDSPFLDYELTKTNDKLTPGQVWSGKGLFQAGGALAVMEYEFKDWFATEIVPGYVQTPYTDVRLNDGDFTLKFRARSLDKDSTTVKIEVYDPYTTNNIDYAEVKITDQWREVSATLCHPGFGNHLAYMQMVAMEGSWLLDDFSIEQEYTTVMPPITHFAKNVTHNQFTANWNTAPMAVKYLVSAFSVDKDKNRQYILQDAETSASEYTVTGTEKGVQYYYTVKSVSDRFTSSESEPKAVNVPLTSLETPVALEAIDVTDSGFTACWEPTFRAMAYIVNLKKVHVANGEEEITILKEDFDKCKGYKGAPAPFYDNLDDVTNMPGWTSSDFIVSLDGMIGIDNYYKKYQDIYLTSPALELSSAGGAFKVSMKVQGEVGQKLNVSSNGTIKSYTLVAEDETVELDFTNGKQGTILTFNFDGSGYLFFDEIRISQIASDGDKIIEPIAAYNTNNDDTQFTLSNLESIPGKAYLYTITAWSYSLGEDGIWGPNVYSEASQPIEVVLKEPEVVSNIENNSLQLRVENNRIIATTAIPSRLEIFSTTGALLAVQNISAGTNIIEAPASGVLFVRALGQAQKIMIQ